jgi:hypothetical protein
MKQIRKIIVMMIFLLITINVAFAYEESTNENNISINQIETGLKELTIIKPILHRTVKYCDTNQSEDIPESHIDNRLGMKINYETNEQTIDLNVFQGGTYGNYDCMPRYYEHCIWDGSFDKWYDEWCEYNVTEKKEEMLLLDNNTEEKNISEENITIEEKTKQRKIQIISQIMKLLYELI